MTPRLEGKVAGATRGAGRGISVELGAAGAAVYVTGRSTWERRSEYDRPETIEETVRGAKVAARLRTGTAQSCRSVRAVERRSLHGR